MIGEDTGTLGQTVGRYHLHRQIAKGGMARIHIARAIGSGNFTRLVAAKRLDPQLANDEEFVEMFLDEARVASKIHHRNVVPVLDVVSHEGEVIMVQELVHGAPLHKLFARAQLANQRIPVDIAVAIAAQVLSGLHAAHEAVDETGESLHIVHRDVSPQNVMIATDGTARLLDFGVAKASTAAKVHVTRAGTFKGKVSYSSPEHLLAAATRQSDVYSLGVVLWELLVGDRMHVGRPDREVFTAILDTTPRPISEVLAAERAAGMIDDATWAQLIALEPVVQRALARDLEKRFATAAEMEDALLAAVAPASFGQITAWMRALAQDLLDETEQLIAAEEASWRKWRASGSAAALANGSGCLPTPLVAHAAPPAAMNEYPRRSTSLETKAIKPSALARLGEVARLSRPPVRRWLPMVEAVAVIVALMLMIGSPGQPTAATALPPAAPVDVPATGARVVAPETVPSAPAPTNRSVTRRAPPKAHAVKRAADCSSSFYFEGSKKIFKPACL